MSTFNRIAATGSSAGSTLGTVGAGKQWIILGLQVSNIEGSLLTINVTAAGKSLATDIPLPAGSSLGLVDGKLVLNAGDTLTEQVSVDSGADILVSYMELELP